MFASNVAREFALAQAAIEHGVYFLELGAEQRAAAYFQFASDHLKRMAYHLIMGKVINDVSTRSHAAQPSERRFPD